MANEQNLIPVKKGEIRNPNGRPKKLVSAVLDELKSLGYKPVSKTQIAEIYQVMITLPKDKLVDIGNNEDAGMLFRILAKGILGGKGFEIIEKMLDRAQGKAMDVVMNLEAEDFIREYTNYEELTGDRKNKTTDEVSAEQVADDSPTEQQKE